MFDMSLTYILVALVAVLLNNALVERLSLHTRITAGTLPAAHPAPSPHTCPSHAPPFPACAALSLSVRWAHLLGMSWGSTMKTVSGPCACNTCWHDACAWRGCCAPHMCPGALALPCSSSPLCLHGNIQLQNPAQEAPPPGSLLGAPPRTLRCPRPPSIKGKKAERGHLRPGSMLGGWGAPPAHHRLPPL